MSSDTEPPMKNKEAFIVEEILDVRRRGGRKEYLLKWKNFPPDENSWEPEANLNCPDLIERFNVKRQPARGHQQRANFTPQTSSAAAVVQPPQSTVAVSGAAIIPALIRDRSPIRANSGGPTREKADRKDRSGSGPAKEKTEKADNGPTKEKQEKAGSSLAKPSGPVKIVNRLVEENSVEKAAAVATAKPTGRVTRQTVKASSADKAAAVAPSTSRAAVGNSHRSTKPEKDGGAEKAASTAASSTAASSSRTAINGGRMVTRSAGAASGEVEAIIGCMRSSDGSLMLLVKYKYQSVAKHEPMYDVHERHPLLVLDFLAERIAPVYSG